MALGELPVKGLFDPHRGLHTQRIGAKEFLHEGELG